jgi:tripartite-type tricarboxylate transporter receptor subunit TctC
MINEVPMTLVGKPQLPANTYRDFENYIRANAGKLNIAHAGLGSASHICGLLWQSTLQTKDAMTTIPFGGTAPAMTALMGGQVDVMCDQTTNTTSQIESGRIKAFAVTTAKPLSNHPVLKHYPSLQEMGLKNFNLTIWHGMYAPKGTPPDVLKMLNDGLKKALKDPEFIKRQEGLGAIVVTDKRVEPAEHKKFVAAEMEKIKAAVDAAGKYAD